MRDTDACRNNRYRTIMTSIGRSEPEKAGPSLPDSDRWSVVSARGAGCWELAQILAGDDAHVAQSDLRDACSTARADFIVRLGQAAELGRRP